jgi:hypothetical protein
MGAAVWLVCRWGCGRGELLPEDEFLDLAGGGGREGVHEDPAARCLVGGQVGAAVRCQFLLGHGAAGGRLCRANPRRRAVFENLDPGGTRLTELAARAGITRQPMTKLVSVLKQQGYLERRPDPSDGRARIVRPTLTGRQMATEVS